ncbi:type I addiction module toxin, SymE family [Pedobacter steynii]|uniref:SymE family type I addiction module toxin n=1 Tax=Pedobacter steynii TaxID=430522 RepID=UPI000942FD5E|nr:type I addiction module toxin, SymE family [Pedobacter steynii]
MRVAKKNKVRTQKVVRSLKVQPQIRFNRNSRTIYPQIILSGNWLNSLGFAPNSHVWITTSNRKLVIIPMSYR